MFNLHSPLVSVISDILKRGAASGEFRNGVDPVHVYISIASLGILLSVEPLDALDHLRQQPDRAGRNARRGRHITAVILGYLRLEKRRLTTSGNL